MFYNSKGCLVFHPSPGTVTQSCSKINIYSGSKDWFHAGCMASVLKHGAASRTVWICAVLLVSCALHGQEICAVEVKLLLLPAEAPAAIASLKLEKETTGQVYFFDTDALDLLSKGLIIRVRQGGDNDLTVKVRPPEAKKFRDPTHGHEDFKCENELTGGEETTSYSIRKKYDASQVPDAGHDISNLLSDGQKKLIRETQISIDWSRVRRIASIRSTGWDTRAQPPFDKLTLEFWEWPAGTILELSTKVGPGKGPATYGELRRLVNTKGLSVSASQSSKTSTVLKSVVGRTAQ